MAESAYALVSVAEVKERLQLAGTEKTPLLEGLVNQASDLIEQFLERHIVTRGSVTEYHSPDGRVSDLYTRDWPIITITSIAESTGWARDYSTALVDGTGYQAVKPKGILRRLGTSGPVAWAAGSRTVASARRVPARWIRPWAPVPIPA